MTNHRNAILARISPTQDGGLLSALSLASFWVGDVIQEAGRPVEYCYFIDAGLASLVKGDVGGYSIECASIGYMYGLSLGSVVHDAPPIVSTIAQQPVRAWRVRASVLRAACAKSPSVRHSISIAQAQLTELVQLNAACNGLHDATQRLARWLLRADDFSPSRELELTQDFIGHMLGARRPTLSVCAAELQDAGIIKYNRGRLFIRDREALAQRACSCYKQELELNIVALKHLAEPHAGAPDAD